MPNNKPGTELVPYKKNKKGSGIIPILMVLLLIAALTGIAWYFTRDDGGASTKQPNIDILVTPGGCDKVEVAKQAMIAQGFQPSEFVVGANQVNWNAPEANERSATASFSSVTPTNAKALVKELSSGTEQAKAAVDTLKEESSATKEELLTPKNWIPVQFKVASSWDGNTAYRNGDAVSAGTRTSSSGDVVWLFVHPKKCKPGTPVIDIVTAHRAGCGNPQTALPRPVTPTPPPSGEQGKDHRLAPPTTIVLYCPPGQYLDRYTETCISPPATTTTTDGGQGDSGDGATNTTTPPTTVAPPVTVPTTTPPTEPPPPPTIPSL